MDFTLNKVFNTHKNLSPVLFDVNFLNELKNLSFTSPSSIKRFITLIKEREKNETTVNHTNLEANQTNSKTTDLTLKSIKRILSNTQIQMYVLRFEQCKKFLLQAKGNLNIVQLYRFIDNLTFLIEKLHKTYSNVNRTVIKTEVSCIIKKLKLCDN